MENAIFYFSGTGNSLKVCKDLSIELKNLQIIPISTVIKEDIKYPIEKLGIVFPVYFAALPPLVADFIRKLNTSKINYIYAIATCNDFSGAALHIVKKILKKKGKRLNFGFSIIMPGNYLPMYPPLPKDKQEKQFKIEIQKVKNKIESTLQFSEVNILDKAMNLAYAELLGDATHINEEIYKYQAVTGEDILRSAQEVFRTDNCSTLYYHAN